MDVLFPYCLHYIKQFYTDVNNKVLLWRPAALHTLSKSSDDLEEKSQTKAVYSDNVE